MFQNLTFRIFLAMIFCAFTSQLHSMKRFKNWRKKIITGNMQTENMQLDKENAHKPQVIENKETLLERVTKYLETQSQITLKDDLSSQILKANQKAQKNKRESQIKMLNKIFERVLDNREELDDTKLAKAALGFITNQGADIATFTNYTVSKSKYPKLSALQELLQ